MRVVWSSVEAVTGVVEDGHGTADGDGDGDGKGSFSTDG